MKIDWLIVYSPLASKQVDFDNLVIKIKKLDSFEFTNKIGVLTGTRRSDKNLNKKILNKLGKISTKIDFYDKKIKNVQLLITGDAFCIINKDFQIVNLDIVSKHIKQGKLPFQPRYFTKPDDKGIFHTFVEKIGAELPYNPNLVFDYDMPFFYVSKLFKEKLNNFSFLMESIQDINKLYLVSYLNTHKISDHYKNTNLLCDFYESTVDDFTSYSAFAFLRTSTSKLLKSFKNNVKQRDIAIDNYEFNPTTLEDKKNLLSVFNPTGVIDKSGKVYLVARSEDKLQKTGQDWSHSNMKYKFIEYDSDKLDKCKSQEEATFVKDDYEYNNIVRETASNIAPAFEDGRVIHDTEEYDKSGNIRSILSSFQLIRDYDVSYLKKKLKKEIVWKLNSAFIRCHMAICKINFIDKKIEWLDYIDEPSQNTMEKNWGVFFYNNLFFCIYSWKNLVYAHSKNLSELKFDSSIENKRYKFGDLSITTNPLNVGGNEFITILHNKKVEGINGYSFYLANFFVTDNNKIKKKTIKKLNLPKEYHFCPSLLKKSEDEVILLMGVHDLNSAHVTLNFRKILEG